MWIPSKSPTIETSRRTKPNVEISLFVQAFPADEMIKRKSLDLQCSTVLLEVERPDGLIRAR